MDRYDVAIVGAGPAGLALAAAVVRRGATVVVIDPAPRSSWKPVWCVFQDELPEVPVIRSWSHTRVELDGGSKVRARVYQQVDRNALQQGFLDQIPTLLTARVQGVEWAGWGGVLQLDQGRIQADRIVDCSGAAQVLANNPAPSAFQTALGWEIETGGHPWQVHEATWMDLRDLACVPTFLYALPHTPTRVFVEETSLAARPGVPEAVLEERLQARLARLDIEVRSIEAVERCRIPLDLAPHPRLAFGMAAGMVHPATGYLLARVLLLADAMAAALDAPERVAGLFQPRVRHLHLVGLETLLRADGAATAEFFETFFHQHTWVQDSFLSPTPTFWSTMKCLSRIFVTAPIAVKWRLTAPLVSQP